MSMTPRDLRRWGSGLTAASAAGGGGTYAATKDKRKSEAAVAGGLAGQGTYQSATYGLKHFAQHQERMAELSRSRKDKMLKPVKREHGAFTAGMYRNYPKDLPGWQANRAAGWIGRGRSGMALGAAATVGGGLAALKHRDVSKAIPLRTLAGYAERNWKDAVTPAMAATGTAATGAAADRRRGGRSSGGTAGAVAGGAAGEVAWRTAGLSLTARGHKLERQRPEGMSRSQYQKITSQHRRAHGVDMNDRRTVARNPSFARTYPKELPAWRYKRIVGQMSGKRGLAAEAGVVGASALAGRKVARRDGRTGIGKRMVDEEKRTNPLRAAQLAAGVGLVAVGGPRMLGPAIAHGIKNATIRGQGIAPRGLIELEAARRAWLTGTQPVVRKLPGLLKSPGVATAAGAALAAHAVPVKQKTYRPVVMV